MRSVATVALIAIVVGAAACGEDAAKPPVTPTPTCAFSVAINTSQFGPGGGSATATVGTTSSCAWTASAEADWIAIEGSSNRSGDGTVSMAIKPFDGTSERTASITIAQQAFKLTQNSCVIRLSDSDVSFTGDGGTKDIRVDTDPACKWSTEGDTSWARLDPPTGTGPASTRIRVNRNESTASRTTALHLGGQELTLRQAGGNEPPSPPTPPKNADCVYSVNPVEAYVHSQGGNGVVDVSAPAGCAWTAAPSAPEAHIVRGESGTGPGQIEYVVDRNPETYVSGFRKVAIQVRWPTATEGQNVWLSQFGNCGAAGMRFPYTIPAAGGRIYENVLVESAFTCPWRVQGGASWATTVSPPLNVVGRGDFTLHVAIAPNTTGQVRTTELIVAERIYVITQLAQ